MEIEEISQATPETTTSAASPADSASDTRSIENIPLLVSIHDSTESQTHRYGSIAENNGEGSGDQYLLESFASMENNTFFQHSEESAESSGTESEHSVTA